jgi:phosphatidylglycerophosphate synthase
MLQPPTEGERWARGELARLRDARWSPPGLARFLIASQRRATDTRRGRPRAARQATAWMLGGAVAGWLATGRRPAGPGRRAGAWWAAWWVACALMLDWHLGMLETPDGRPVALGAPDALTLLRAWLVPIVAVEAAPPLVAVGALSDLLDGVLARRTRTTRLGRDLEGLVDACFTTAALRGAVRAGAISRLPAALELGRLLIGTGYACGVYFTAAHAPRRVVTGGGRRAAPVRMASLVVAGWGRRRIADRLLLAATALALAGLAERPVADADVGR